METLKSGATSMLNFIKGLLYVNNEPSLTRFFLTISFVIAIGIIVGMVYGWFPIKQEFIDLVKWILGFALGGKTADNLITQVFGSPRGITPVKNPRGENDGSSDV